MSSAAGSTVRRRTWLAAAAVLLAAAMAAIAWAVPARVQAQPLGQARPSTAAPRGAAPGYLLDKGRFLGFDIPGATAGGTVAGVNDRNQIVGTVFDATVTPSHGFLLPKGGAEGPFRQIDVPGAPRTAATGINERGAIAGNYANPNPAATPQATGMQALSAMLG